jgi:hypothetical protein
MQRITGDDLGWITYITRGMDPQVRPKDDAIEIELSSLEDCNNLSKRIQTDPNTDSPAIAETEIVISSNGREWDRFKPKEISLAQKAARIAKRLSKPPNQ